MSLFFSNRGNKGCFVKKAESDRRKLLSQIHVLNQPRQPQNKENHIQLQAGTVEEITWAVGRRIVELECLAKGLEECEDCKTHLSLSNIVSEKRYGFGSLLYVQCDCGFLNNVYTGKRHRTDKQTRGIPIYDINTKAATGKDRVS